jgi:hypothetical protein
MRAQTQGAGDRPTAPQIAGKGEPSQKLSRIAPSEYLRGQGCFHLLLFLRSGMGAKPCSQSTLVCLRSYHRGDGIPSMLAQSATAKPLGH